MKENEIDIVTLGCSKNLVDAERLMRRLEIAGWHCVHDAEHPRGEIAIINTCGFIGDAKEESIRTILEFAARKSAGKLKKLYVMGCLSERYRHDLEAEIEEVDGWFGKFDFLGIVEAIGEKAKGREGEKAKRREGEKAKGREGEKAKRQEDEGQESYERVITTPSHYAYLKISEGCNRHCSYCAIPLITGRHISRPKDEILAEVRWLVAQGVKELNVIAQDLSSYGLDTEHRHGLAPLLDEMSAIPGVEWIRLHYAYPADFPYDILPVMARKKNICKYLDIALQHCTDSMLNKMHRHITRAEQDELIERIRREVPGICIRTTLMVGHPGETQEDFDQLCAWTRKMRFDRMGAFAYSDEEGTFAHKHYADDIPQEVKQERLNTLMAIQQEISGELLQQMVGTQQRVIVDRREGDYYIGRTQYDSPEVDCEVLISTNHPLQIGAFYIVTIQKAEDFDLYASL